MNKIIEIRAPKTLGGESITEGVIKIKKSIGDVQEKYEKRYFLAEILYYFPRIY